MMIKMSFDFFFFTKYFIHFPYEHNNVTNTGIYALLFPVTSAWTDISVIALN